MNDKQNKQHILNMNKKKWTNANIALQIAHKQKVRKKRHKNKGKIYYDNKKNET